MTCDRPQFADGGLIQMEPGEFVVPAWMLDRYCEALRAVPEVDRRRLRDGEWTEDVGGDS